MENHSSSLWKAGNLARHPTMATEWGLLQDRQPHAPKPPGDAQSWTTTEEPYRPPAHPAEQAELRSVSTELETASNPSAPPLPTCTSVLAAGGCDDKDALLAVRRAIRAPAGPAADLCRNYHSKPLLCMLSRTQQDYTDLPPHTLQHPYAIKGVQ